MSEPLLLDLSHTSHTRARTGIQRVARSLHHAMNHGAVAITHDPHAGVWRTLQTWEQHNLTADSAAPKRGAQWPMAAKLSGRVRRLVHRVKSTLPPNAGLLVPEIFSPAVARALPDLFAQTSGPRVALFHDAIALKLPELTPPATVARFPAYLVELLAFDGIAAVSEDSRNALIDYWQWIGAKNPPPVQTIPLGVADGKCHPMGDASNNPARPVVLCVGSIEGRKNHLALLEACERLWAGGREFTLHVIGLAQRQTGAVALERIRALQASGRALRYHGPATDEALNEAYAECEFTVYPSSMEGFGLPVIESLQHGKPCICAARGALGESARGGGCMMLDAVDAASLANAIERLLASRETLERLAAEARARAFKSWSDYAGEIAGWMRGLPRRT